MPPKDKTSPYVPAKAIADFLSRYASPDETEEAEQGPLQDPTKLPPPTDYTTPSSQGLLDLPIFPGGAGSLAAQTLAAGYLPKAISALPEPLQVPTQIGLLAAPFAPKVPGAAVSGLKWAAQPKHIGAGAERLTKLMMKHPESGVQKGLNELFGSLAKTKAFAGQMESTPLAGKMFSHYFTGKGAPLNYKFPRFWQEDVIKNNSLKLRTLARNSKTGEGFNISIREGMLGRDLANALGNFTLQGKVVKRLTPVRPRKAGDPYGLNPPSGGDAIVRLRNYDTYNFKPNLDLSKTWHFKADLPAKIADKLPNFRINNPTSGSPTAKSYTKYTQDTPTFQSLSGTDKSPLLDISKHPANYLKPQRGTKVTIRGLDAVFPKLGIGKPFSSYSKPYYYNTKTRQFGHTLKSVL